MTIKVFLADDHAVLRDGLKLLLKGEPDMDMVGEAATGRDAVYQVITLQPDIVIMDIAMPDLNGIDATRQIHEANPAIQVIVLSMHDDNEYIFQALRAGVRGYLLKETAGFEVINAIRAVHAGQRYLSQKISDKVIGEYITQHELSEAESPLEQLSSREREILQLVAEGKTTADIADVLLLAPSTVQTYRSRVMQKLGITDLSSLIKFAIQHGLTPLK